MGVSTAEAAQAMIAAGADIFGANCGSVTPGQMAEIVREFRRATNKPILIQANAGVPELQAGKTIFRLAPEEFADGNEARPRCGRAAGRRLLRDDAGAYPLSAAGRGTASARAGERDVDTPPAAG